MGLEKIERLNTDAAFATKVTHGAYYVTDTAPEPRVKDPQVTT